MSPGGLERIETAHMVGERLRPEHAAELTVLLADPRVARMLSPHEGPRSAARVEEIVTQQAAAWGRDGFGMWLLRDGGDGTLVGRGGLQRTEATGVSEVEIGWAIVPERWGQGLATELGRASIAAGFGELELGSVIAYTLVSNGASRRVMEKTGLEYERGFQHVGLPHVVYRRRRSAGG